MKMWMVEGQWKLPGTKSWPYDTITPVRSVVQARTKKEAQKGAKAAVQAAMEILQSTNTPEGELVGTPHVLYAM